MLSHRMLWWIAALASAGSVPLLLDDAPVEVVPRFDTTRRTLYRQQLHLALDGPLESRLDAQQEVEVEVPYLPPGGGAQVRTRTRTVTGVSQLRGAAPVPAAPAEHSTTWLVGVDGIWRPVQRTGPESLHQALGGLAPTAGGFSPPSGSLEVGRRWSVPIELELEADGPGPQGLATTVLSLAGTSEWRFVGWARIEGVRCAMLEESQRLSGTSATGTNAPHTGVASARTSEVCWDPELGAVHWQRAESRTVLHDGSSDERLRMTIRLVTGRVRQPPGASGVPSGSSSTSRTWPR